MFTRITFLKHAFSDIVLMVDYLEMLQKKNC